jgi:hypothetical protein
LVALVVLVEIRYAQAKEAGRMASYYGSDSGELELG